MLIGGLLAGVGAYLLQRQQDSQQVRYERELRSQAERADERHGALTEQLVAVQRGNEALLKKIGPFEEIARRRFPELGAEEALERLRRELSQVRDLATRDIPRNLEPGIRSEVIARLRELAQQSAPKLRLQLHNADALNARRFFDELQMLLRGGGIQYEITGGSGRTGSTGSVPPYILSHRPGGEDTARRLISGMAIFLKTEPVIRATDRLPANVLELAFRPQQVDFQAEGSVILR